MDHKRDFKKSAPVLVVGLGQACVDYLGRLYHYPAEDKKVELNELHTGFGGPAATAVVTLARLGIPVAFMGSVSDDPLGMGIVKNLEEKGVDISFLKIRHGCTSQFAFVAVTGGVGKRTVFWHRGTAPHITPGEVDLSVFPDARYLHLDGLMIEASAEAADQARKNGLTVVMDAGTFREGSRDLLSKTDILIASENFSDPLVKQGNNYEQALKVLKGFGPKVVIITLGEKGSIGTDGQQTFYQESFRVDAVDTTGAGDVYHGAYIYGLIQGWDIPGCMRFASAASALKCRKIGAQSGIPGLDDVYNLVKQ